jgi:hypothetical protein
VGRKATPFLRLSVVLRIKVEKPPRSNSFSIILTTNLQMEAEYQTGVEDFHHAFPKCANLLTSLISCKQSESRDVACDGIESELRYVVVILLFRLSHVSCGIIIISWCVMSSICPISTPELKACMQGKRLKHGTRLPSRCGPAWRRLDQCMTKHANTVEETAMMRVLRQSPALVPFTSVPTPTPPPPS